MQWELHRKGDIKVVRYEAEQGQRRARLAEHEAQVPVHDDRQGVGGSSPFFWVYFRTGFNDAQNLTLHGFSTYDPFSRYAPFRVEARLDQIILKDIVKFTVAK
jgi:hypothetical protein